MDGRENEKTERGEDCAEADHLAEVTGIKQSPNGVRK
jgi:hypothetical protein